MKGIIIASLILLAGLAFAYTPEQQTALDGMNLSFELGIAYENALKGQNVAEYNFLVDEYNTWIQQHYGVNEGLLKSKLSEYAAPTLSNSGGTRYLTTRPFNASSDLSRFGEQQVYVLPFIFTTEAEDEEAFSQQEAERFLNS